MLAQPPYNEKRNIINNLVILTWNNSLSDNQIQIFHTI